jgi:RNA polymerase sigma-70 factor (ECF subfamily)
MANEVEISPEDARSPDPVFAALLRRMRAGCPDAAQELFERYQRPLRLVIRRRLHRRLRTIYDSLDFVQSVWASFLQTPPEDDDCRTSNTLEAYLARVATNKVIEVYRQRMQTVRHDLSRERGYAALGKEPSAQDPGPTASQLAIAEEHWQRLMEGQPPKVRQVLELLRHGHTHVEVARQCQLPRKMIQRLLQKIRKRLGSP